MTKFYRGGPFGLGKWTRRTAFSLAALAATAPAAGGQTVPEFGLPWTFEDEGNSVRAQAICPVP